MTNARENLDALIAKLEGLTGPDREVDAAIRHEVIGDFAYCNSDTGHTCAKYPNCCVEGEGCGQPWGMSDERRSYPRDWRDDDRLPKYTGDLQVALGLVPDGWRWAMDFDPHRGPAYGVSIKKSGDDWPPRIFASTPEIAATIAALKAIAAEQENKE